MNYQPLVGIEIHVELKTASKMFCGCKNDPFHANKPNIHTCPVCLGMPGGLPVANKKAIEWTVKIGHALGCTINHFSKFDRKHYFYPDLAKGYQISQYDQPFCVNGIVPTEFGDVRISRVHLEEDTGKLLHETVEGQKVSLIDFNRSGVPLVEIVTEADITSAQQAKAYTQKIAQIIRFLEVSEADMEKGSMRLEANISVRNEEEQESKAFPPYKVEVKNLNSFKYIQKAIEYETLRQSTLRDEGEVPTQETRGWSEEKKATFSQRSKESAEDYRYFPDPDLPPIRLDASFVNSIKASLPRMPDDYVKSWMTEHGVKESDALILTAEPVTALFIDTLIKKAREQELEPAKVVSLVVNKKIEVNFLSSPSADSAIIEASVDQVLSRVQALAQTDQVSDDEIDQVINEVLAENLKAVQDFKAGKTQVLGFLLGMTKRKLGKNVDNDKLMENIKRILSS